MVGLLYFLGAAFSVRFTRYDGGAAFLWVSTAVLLAELATTKQRRWARSIATCAIASMAATSFFGIGVAAAPFFAIFAIGEAVVAALVLRRLPGRSIDLGSLAGVGRFVLVAGIAAPALSGLGGAAVVLLMTGKDFWPNWFHWFAGRVLGNITFTPILILLFSGELFGSIASFSQWRRIEAASLALLMIAVSWGVFAQSTIPMLFLPTLPMIVAAFRFGRHGGAIAVVILITVGGILTLNGYGPVNLLQGAPGRRALFVQFYLAISALVTLPVAAELNERRRLFLALLVSEARYRLIADGSSDVILNLAIDGTIQYASPSIAELGGYDPANLLGTNASALVIGEDRARVAAVHAKAVAQPNATFIVEYRALTVQGATLWCETHTRGIVGEDGSVLGVVSVIRDISGHKTVEAELARAATTDPLTGLVNRRAFDEALERRLEEVRTGRGQGCCAILDLDFFKRVNDQYGHAAGDQVLRIFAKVASRALRDTDLIARLGGEEFGLILWGADLSEAHAICDRLRQEVADLLVETSDGAAIHVTVSGGVAKIDPSQTRSTILREADDALYRAKGAGRNRLALAA